MNEDREVRVNPILFYDGTCGLCHGAVLFVLKRDRAGLFRFAPLQSETLVELVPEDTRAALPDSLVLREPDGRLFTRSSAVVGMLRRLGPFWSAMGALLWVIPRPLRDLGYDLMAKVRHRLFREPQDACPLVPVELRGRFLP
ncbi:MAG TPA: DCC1-like thiol-disulfide oxidoreductase family protein [Holophagaceae bacterium]|jgi:predicted DCC family thiol-disulfide oxidoreductase YuxK|nr:DCC1-like thiol-disulfide oxidoreductase family protein [Holophagaceae bacterium]